MMNLFALHKVWSGLLFSLALFKITWIYNFMIFFGIWVLDLLIHIIFRLIDWIFHLKLTNLIDSQWWVVLFMIIFYSISFVAVLELDNYREIKIKLNLVNKKKYYINIGLFTIIASSVFLIIPDYIISSLSAGKLLNPIHFLFSFL